MRNKKDIEGWEKLQEFMGGEVGEIIKKFQNKDMRCCKNSPIRIDFFVGYEHSGGLKDARGNKW